MLFVCTEMLPSSDRIRAYHGAPVSRLGWKCYNILSETDGGASDLTFQRQRVGSALTGVQFMLLAFGCVN